METWVDLPGVDIHAFQTLPSTQDYLLPMARLSPQRPILCVTDHQTQGRGRGAKTWHAPIGATLCFSLCIRMDKPLHALGGLTLAYGVALCKALAHLGAQGLKLKWPNDIYGAAGKLAGILTETYAATASTTYIIVGVGVNIDAPALLMNELHHPWADLISCSQYPLPPHKEILVLLVKALLSASALYEHEGFAAFHTAYDAFDMLKGNTVTLDSEQNPITATVLGVSESGELLIDQLPFKLASAIFI